MCDRDLVNERYDESRRSFLARTTAMGAAAAAVIGTTSSQANATWAAATKGMPFKQVDDDKPIRMGVIGTGGMGTHHTNSTLAQAERGEANVQVVALSDVCDSKVEAARKTCEEKQGITVTAYRDYRDLLARDDIHCVLIASPEHWHGQMARDAILAGKDVYLEKPMTLKLDDALRLREVILANPDKIFQVGTQKIILPKFVEALRLVREGAIGHPTSSQTSYCRNSRDGEWLYYGLDANWKPGVNLDWDRWCGPAGKTQWDPEIYARWRRYKNFSTGIVGDLLVHQMTPLIMAVDAGWPTRVNAIGGHYVDKVMENHDQVNITAQFEKNHTMIIAGSTCNEAGLETMIRGHEANIYLGGRHCEVRPERLYADEIDPIKVECPDIGNDQEKLRLNWFECIRSREAAISNVDLGTKVMIIVDLATRSMWHGGSYAFDPKTMSVKKL